MNIIVFKGIAFLVILITGLGGGFLSLRIAGLKKSER